MENSKTVFIDIVFCNGEWIFESIENYMDPKETKTIYLENFEIFDDVKADEQIILTINAEECETREDFQGFCDIEKFGPKITGLLLVFNSDWFQNIFLGFFELLAEASNNLEWVNIDCDFYPPQMVQLFCRKPEKISALKEF